MPSLRLGTAQWGLHYGITNSFGRIPDPELIGIVRLATQYGIRLLDTAPAYGDAETRLSEVDRDFKIQTKVIGAKGSTDAIYSQVHRSLQRLNRDSVESVLVHDWTALTLEERSVTRAGLVNCRALGLVTHIGVSLYVPSEISTLFLDFPEATVVQAPVSVLDQRFLQMFRAGGNRLADMRFQARSVFLQGALLSTPGQLPFGGHPDIFRLREVAKENACSPLELSLAFVMSQPEIDEVVVGVTSEAELAQILVASERQPLPVNWANLQSYDLELLDPRRWTKRL